MNLQNLNLTELNGLAYDVKKEIEKRQHQEFENKLDALKKAIQDLVNIGADFFYEDYQCQFKDIKEVEGLSIIFKAYDEDEEENY